MATPAIRRGPAERGHDVADTFDQDLDVSAGRVARTSTAVDFT
jgi:hypothetical protein